MTSFMAFSLHNPTIHPVQLTKNYI